MVDCGVHTCTIESAITTFVRCHFIFMAVVITIRLMTKISDSAPPSDFTPAQSNVQTCISDTVMAAKQQTEA